MHKFRLDKTSTSVSLHFSRDTKHVIPNVSISVIPFSRTEMFVSSPCNWSRELSSSPFHRHLGAAIYCVTNPNQTRSLRLVRHTVTFETVQGETCHSSYCSCKGDSYVEKHLKISRGGEDLSFGHCQVWNPVVC
jgi:hypothetical protein